MKFILSFLPFVFLFSACYKDDTGTVLTMPDKTQTGKHTFGFLLNADVWTNYGQVCNIGGCHDNLSGRYYRSDGDVSIGADKVIRRKNLPVIRERFGVELVTNFRGTRQYSVAAGDTVSVGYNYEEVGQPEKFYKLPVNNPNFVITLTKIDTINNILSGEFSGTLFQGAPFTTAPTSLTDSIIIKDGRFDIKMK